MENRVISVFYGQDMLPYKDSDRTVHYPVTSSTFAGSNNVSEIHLYVDQIGGTDNISWVVVSKLPNGKLGYEPITTLGYDDELEVYYLVFTLSSYYTQAKGVLKLALRGYSGTITFEQVDGVYQISGDPSIEVTGTIDFAINYSPFVDKTTSMGQDEYLLFINALANYIPKVNGIVVLDDISDTDLSDYLNGQIIYDKATRQYYLYNGSSYSFYDNGFVKMLYETITTTDTIASIQTKCSSGTCVLSYVNGYKYLVSFLSSGVSAINLTTLDRYVATTTQLAFTNTFASLLTDTYKNSVALDSDISALSSKYTKYIYSLDNYHGQTWQTIFDLVGSPFRQFIINILGATCICYFDEYETDKYGLLITNVYGEFFHDIGDLSNTINANELSFETNYLTDNVITIYADSGTLDTNQINQAEKSSCYIVYPSYGITFRYVDGDSDYSYFRSDTMARTSNGVTEIFENDVEVDLHTGEYVVAGSRLIETYTKSQIDTMLTSMLVYKGSLSVAQVSALDTSTLQVGYFYNVTDSGTITWTYGGTSYTLEVLSGDNIAWTGSEWDKLTMDLSAYDDKFISAGFFEVQDYDEDNGTITFVYASDLYDMSYDSDTGVMTITAN